jgi:prepilin-type N-terminal cleavage/methylation domain-containing protein/prepilin-type processing-associated H-X9-DG protein
MPRRRYGFTLIELLVVIAIIGILAAMLFPVFARAREAARKVQCLANVKNIAIAIQMYLTDYDMLPPREHRAEVQAAFDTYGGKSNCQYATGANPYLRWPVILDEYIKNRDVWSCPSAGRMPRISICPGPDWFTATMAHQDEWGCYGTICTAIYPPGWGGAITDSFVQQDCSTSRTDGKHDANAFVQTIGCPSDYERKTSEMQDPAKYVVCGETGAIDTMWDAALAAYPDVCGLACDLVGGVCWSDKPYGLHADWENCDSSVDCGAGDLKLGTDIEYRKSFCKARHLGGENLGFADGHAKWMSAEAIISATKPTSDTAPGSTTVMGYFGPATEMDWAITGGIEACTYPCCRQR